MTWFEYLSHKALFRKQGVLWMGSYQEERRFSCWVYHWVSFFFLIKRGSVQRLLNNATTHMNLESDSLNILVCTALLFLTVLKYVCREAVFSSCSGHEQREEWSGIDILRNRLCPTDHCGLADADRQAPSGQHSGTASFFLPLKKIIDSRSK